MARVSEEEQDRREEQYVLEKLREVGTDLKSLVELSSQSLSLEQAKVLQKCLRVRNAQPRSARLRSSNVPLAILNALPKPPARTPADQAEIDREASELVSVMQAAGLNIQTPADLCNIRLDDHSTAIESLVTLLGKFKRQEIKDSIIRGLADLAARGIAETALLEEWRGTPLEYTNLNHLWVVGLALGKVATENSFPVIAEILRDKRYGMARQELVLYLVRVKNPAAKELLFELLDDDDITLHVMEALARRRDSRASVAIEKLRMITKWDWPTAVKNAQKLLKK